MCMCVRYKNSLSRRSAQQIPLYLPSQDCCHILHSIRESFRFSDEVDAPPWRAFRTFASLFLPERTACFHSCSSSLAPNSGFPTYHLVHENRCVLTVSAVAPHSHSYAAESSACIFTAEGSNLSDPF